MTENLRTGPGLPGDKEAVRGGGSDGVVCPRTVLVTNHTVC